VNKIRKSVMGVLCHEDEYLFVRRQNYLNVFPGYTSFPGGKVERSDTCDLPNLLKDFSPDLIECLRRELDEEVGFDLFSAIESGEVIDVIELGKVITPDFNPVRFENFYFSISLKSKPKLNLDKNEIESVSWESAEGILARFQNDEILIVPPMLKLIHGLTNKLPLPLNLDLKYDPKLDVPRINPVYSVVQYLPLSNTFPPANRTNCFVLGDVGQRIVAIDPSPGSAEEFVKLKNSLSAHSLNLIFLTHHHPDHHEFSTVLARELCIPMGMSADTRQRIEQQHGREYFNGIELEIFAEGDVLTICNREKVIIIETPGHDEGQLSLIPESKKWAILSDLFQSIGTVVIGAPEGDMKKYFESMERIIKLSPRVIFPSHGIALGGVNKLQVTLDHRKEREQQVLNLLIEGKTEEEMLQTIYKGVDPKLFPYARKTISAHLKKLKEEGKIKR